MKYGLFLLTTLLITGSMLSGQVKSGTPAKNKPEDQVKKYWFVLIKTGPNTDADSASKEILFKKHMDNIYKLYYDGVLKVSGPFGKNDNEWEGLFIFDCATKEEAEGFLQTDAAIAAGLLSVQVTPWYTAPIGSFKAGKPVKVN